MAEKSSVNKAWLVVGLCYSVTQYFCIVGELKLACSGGWGRGTALKPR